MTLRADYLPTMPVFAIAGVGRQQHGPEASRRG
jgi:hypothetical protein